MAIFIHLINLFRGRTISISFILRVVFNGFFGIIMPMQVRDETEKYLPFVHKLEPETVLEIGTARGGNLFLLAQMAAPSAIIISVDLPNGKYGGGYPRWKIPLFKSFARRKQKIYLIRMDSHLKETLNLLIAILKGKSLDFLFIDGDHSYEGVKSDYRQYYPLVRKGGIAVLHDIVKHAPEFECEVDQFWHELCQQATHLEIVKDPSQGWGGIGLIFK